jgi:2-polyprenyl-6-methoxyphenol hydroxylase-like FAD-dependent oxidoreductase
VEGPDHSVEDGWKTVGRGDGNLLRNHAYGVVVVGGGFSGTMLAANLLRRVPSSSVAVLDKGPLPGRGKTTARTPDQLLFLQYLMNERNCDRSFAHRGRHTFDAFATHVAHREHSRKTGFEQVRPTGQDPVRSA